MSGNASSSGALISAANVTLCCGHSNEMRRRSRRHNNMAVGTDFRYAANVARVRVYVCSTLMAPLNATSADART